MAAATISFASLWIAAPRAFSPTRAPPHRQKVLPVGLFILDAVQAELGGEMRDHGGSVHGRAHGVLVVLDNVHDGAHAVLAPDGGHVHGFMEGPGVHRPVPEETEADAVGALVA